MSETTPGARPFGYATACFAAICAGLLIGSVLTFITDSGEVQSANLMRACLYAIGGQLAAVLIWRARTATGKGRLVIALAGALITAVSLRLGSGFEQADNGWWRLFWTLFTLVAFVFVTLTWGAMAWLVYSVVALGRRVFSRSDSASHLATSDDEPGDPSGSSDRRGILGAERR